MSLRLREGTNEKLPRKKIPELEFYFCDTRDGGQNPKSRLVSPEAKGEYAQLVDRYALSGKRSAGLELVYAGSSNIDRATPKLVQSILTPTQWEKVHAFGSSYMVKSGGPEKDPMMQALLEAETKGTTIYVKSDAHQVKHVLKTDKKTNIGLIEGSVQYLVDKERGVVADMEHFFDGFDHDPEYTKECVIAAAENGAKTIVLCETNGGMLPADIDLHLRDFFQDERIQRIFGEYGVTLGFHPHCDRGQGVENTKRFILNKSVCKYVNKVQIQGNIGQAGERVGNVDLFHLICDLNAQGLDVLEDETAWKLLRWTKNQTSRFLRGGDFPDEKDPYTGREAFTHSGGQHVGAYRKNASTYDRLSRDRQKMGAQVRMALGPNAGKGNVQHFYEAFDLPIKPDHISQSTDHVVNNSQIDYSDSWASAAIDFWCIAHNKERGNIFSTVKWEGEIIASNGSLTTRGTVSLEGDTKGHEKWVIKGKGILHNLSLALRDELSDRFGMGDVLGDIILRDYYEKKDDGKGTGADVKCEVIVQDKKTRRIWSTQAIGRTNDEAGFLAIQDALRYAILVHNSDIQHFQDSTLLERYGTQEDVLADSKDRLGKEKA